MGKRSTIDKYEDSRGHVLQAYGPAITAAIDEGTITKADTFRDNVTTAEFLEELEAKGVRM